MSAIASTIGKRIRAVRQRAGLPQDRFALALGYSKRALINWEHDAAEPPMAILAKLRHLFDVDPEWVVLGEDLDPQSIYKQVDRERWARMAREVDRVCFDVGLDPSAEQRAGLVRSMYEEPMAPRRPCHTTCGKAFRRRVWAVKRAGKSRFSCRQHSKVRNDLDAAIHRIPNQQHDGDDEPDDHRQ